MLSNFCRYKSIILLFILPNFFIATPLFSLEIEPPGNWIMYFGNARFHDRFSLHHEVQFRSYDILPNTEQWLLRGGINYHIDENTLLTTGYGHITNHSATGERISSFEHRIWQQFYTRHNVGRVRMEHRYRLEQRWIKANSNKYLNRARYFYRINIPVTKSTLGPNTFFISIYDEIFLHLNNAPFDRNRLYAAAGYQLNKEVAVQVGYLLQTVGVVTKPYLQFGLFWNLNLRQED